MSEVAGRAGGNIRHLQHRGTKGTGGTRADRASLLHESMRDLDPDAAKIHAAINPNIVLADTHLNVAMVNDGTGGFRRPTSTKEVLDYGDARISNVHRKWNQKSFETTLIAVHLPKTLCEEVPDFYPVIDARIGRQVHTSSGEPQMRSRWVAKDRQQAIDYFDQVVRYYADNVLTGGQEAVHGYDINFDESTPHIQIMADTLGPDPKHEGKLRVDASRMWGTHWEVTVPKLDKATGDVIQVTEQRRAKMARYQKGLREHMHAAGYPVELDYDPERHLSGLGKDEYSRSMDAQRVAVAMFDETQTAVAANNAKVAALNSATADIKSEFDARAAALDDREGVLDRREADIPRLKAKAVEEGSSKGLAIAQKVIDDEVTQRVEAELGPARLALQRQQELAEEKVRDEVRKTQAAAARHQAAAKEFAWLNGQMRPVVKNWEQLNPQTKRGQKAQQQLQVYTKIQDRAAGIRKSTPDDDMEPGG